MPSFLPGLFVALIEKVCIADYQLGWQDFVAYIFQIQIVMMTMKVMMTMMVMVLMILMIIS